MRVTKVEKITSIDSSRAPYGDPNGWAYIVNAGKGVYGYSFNIEIELMCVKSSDGENHVPTIQWMEDGVDKFKSESGCDQKTQWDNQKSARALVFNIH